MSAVNALVVLADPHGLVERATHDERLLLEREIFDDLGVGERIAHALGVREVGAEHDVVDRDPDVDQPLGVGLVERVHPHAPVEHLDGVLVEEHRALVAVPLQLRVEGPDPGAGVLDRQEPELRELGRQAVPDDRCHRVDEVVLLRRQREERRVRADARVARDAHLAVAEAFPLVRVPGVAGVAGVHADGETEFLDPLPERVELGKRERLAALPRGHRRHPDEEDLGAALVDVLELLEGAIEHRERDDRRGVDGVGVHVAPVLVHPLVQRVDHRAHRVGIVGHPLLEHTGERRPQERAVDPHLLHELEPGLGIEEGVEARHRDHLPEAGGRVAEPLSALGDVVAGSTGDGDLGEGRVGDVVRDLAADR